MKDFDASERQRELYNKIADNYTESQESERHLLFLQQIWAKPLGVLEKYIHTETLCLV